MKEHQRGLADAVILQLGLDRQTDRQTAGTLGLGDDSRRVGGGAGRELGLRVGSQSRGRGKVNRLRTRSQEADIS